MNARHHPFQQPPTIAFMKERGVQSFWVTCRVYLRNASVPIGRFKIIPDQTPLEAIGDMKKLRCQGCGSHDVGVAADWIRKSKDDPRG